MPQSVSQEALIALQHIRDGCNTTKLLADQMGESMSAASNLRHVLVHFGAVRQCGRLRNGSKIFEAIPGWVAPPRAAPPVHILTPFDQWLMRGVTLPNGQVLVRPS